MGPEGMEVMSKALTITLAVAVLLSGTAAVALFSKSPEVDEYEVTTVDLNIVVTVQNLGSAPALDIPLRLALPNNHSDIQEIKSIHFHQEPERLTNDTWGNEFIHYTIDQLDPQDSVNFTISIKVKLVSIDYNIRDSDVYPPKENMSRYLEPSQFISANDPGVIELAREIAADSENLVDIAWNTYEWIIENIYYQQIAGEWDAATTLKNGEGGSAELGNLFVALMRANGIPARRISGWGHGFSDYTSVQLTRFAHGWAEFYVEPFGWIPVDPTWGQRHKVDNFARSDPRHIILTRGAGIHFMTRGAYSDPYGTTDVDTDYRLDIKEVRTRNTSFRRDLIKGSLFAAPCLLAVFILIKYSRRRRIHS